jgi:hypothetical protein
MIIYADSDVIHYFDNSNPRVFEIEIQTLGKIQGNHKVSVYLMITVKNTQNDLNSFNQLP